MIRTFHSLECARLPPPAYSLKQFQRLDSEPFEGLDEDFQESFLDLCAFVRQLLRAKSIQGQMLNGYRFVEFCRHIVSLINQNQEICLLDSLMLICEREDKLYENEFMKLSTEFKKK